MNENQNQTWIESDASLLNYLLLRVRQTDLEECE